jgi:hypothetical protein
VKSEAERARAEAVVEGWWRKEREMNEHQRDAADVAFKPCSPLIDSI